MTPAPQVSQGGGISPGSPSIVRARKDIPALTGLRFVAAFSILFMHTLEWTSPFDDTTGARLLAGAAGLIGMPLFFVLSGFVIHYNYGRDFDLQPYRIAIGNFFSARFARIYPLYLFFCIFGIISDDMVSWSSGFFHDLLSSVLHFLTLTQSWVYEVVLSNHRIILANGFGLSWSISCEFFFYLFYTIFVFFILPIKKPRSAILVILLYSTTVFSTIFLAYIYNHNIMEIAREHFSQYISRAQDQDNSFFRWFFYYSPYVRIWEFILGCLAAQLFILIGEQRVTSVEALIGRAGLYLALLGLIIYHLRYVAELSDGADHIVRFFSLNFGCALPIAVIIFCTARYESRVARFLACSWMIWLGEISYSIYAVHTWTVRPFVRPPAHFYSLVAIDTIFRVGFALVFTIIVASATYRIIEVPCRRYLRKRLMHQSTTAAASIMSAADSAAN